MITLIIRCTIIYIIVLIIFRLMGKRQLGQLQPFEFVITLIIADLATMPMADTKIPLIDGIIPLITLCILHFFLSLLSQKSIFFRKVLSGKPVIVISPNGIEYENLKNLNLTLNDVQESLRNLNIYSFEDVLYAIVETNGNITAIPKANTMPCSREDMNIKADENELIKIIISDGKLINENVKYMNISKDWIIKQIKKVGEKSIKNILVLTLDNQGNIYIQPKQKKYTVLKTAYKGEQI